jgi:cation:H+ antiporter
VLLFLGGVTQLEGMLLLVVFGGYTIFLFRTDREALKRLSEAEADEDEDDDQKSHAPARLRWRPVVLTFGGLAAMAAGGPAMVEGALRLAHMIGLSQETVGATIVSLGTGAEMIALGISTAHKKRSDILVGGILGSFAYNLLVMLGLAAAIHPLPVDPHVTFITLPVTVLVHLMLLAFVWYEKIPRIMGGIMIVVYIAYLAGAVQVSFHR